MSLRLGVILTEHISGFQIKACMLKKVVVSAFEAIASAKSRSKEQEKNYLAIGYEERHDLLCDVTKYDSHPQNAYEMADHQDTRASVSAVWSHPEAKSKSMVRGRFGRPTNGREAHPVV